PSVRPGHQCSDARPNRPVPLQGTRYLSADGGA
ncbi:MAG: phage DNA packaging protein J, partial [Candidatus Thiodiazotropha taylori]